MSIYRKTQLRVKAVYGFVPQTCWIAHVLELNGHTLRRAPNRIDGSRRMFPCPPDKRPADRARSAGTWQNLIEAKHVAFQRRLR